MPAIGAEHVPGGIGNAGGQIAFEAARQAKALELEKRHKHIVNNVLGSRSVIEEAHRKSQQIAFIFFIDTPHRFVITAVKSPNQQLVFEIHVCRSLPEPMFTVSYTTPDRAVLV